MNNLEPLVQNWLRGNGREPDYEGEDYITAPQLRTLLQAAYLQGFERGQFVALGAGLDDA